VTSNLEERREAATAVYEVMPGVVGRQTVVWRKKTSAAGIASKRGKFQSCKQTKRGRLHQGVAVLNESRAKRRQLILPNCGIEAPSRTEIFVVLAPTVQLLVQEGHQEHHAEQRRTKARPD
jgi:hypothetical protein